MALGHLVGLSVQTAREGPPVRVISSSSCRTWTRPRVSYRHLLSVSLPLGFSLSVSLSLSISLCLSVFPPSLSVSPPPAPPSPAGTWSGARAASFPGRASP